MAFTPDPNLFANSLGAGVRLGSGFADLFRQRRQESELQRIAQMAASGNPDYNQIGAGLIGAGQVGAGVNALGVPYQREQNELDRAFRRDQVGFQQQQALRGASMDERRFAADQAYRQQQMDIAAQKMAEAQGGGFTTPIQATDADGNPVFIQANDRGQVQAVEGFRPSNPIKTIDLGTHIQTVDSRTNQVLSTVPKANYQEAYEKGAGGALGKADAGSAAQAGGAAQKSAQILDLVSRIESHPGMDDSMGLIQGRLPAMTQQREDFRVLKSQLEGGAFLQAFESLKGGGQITEVEGRKATDALIAMRDTQSPEQFRKLLQVFRENVQEGMRKAAQAGPRLQQRLGTMPDRGTPSVVQPVPQGGGDPDIDALLQKYGQ